MYHARRCEGSEPVTVAVSLLAAAAVLLIVAFQPFGKPKPRLGDRLGALTTAAAAANRRRALREAAGGADAIFDTPFVERTLGAFVRRGGRGLDRAIRLLGRSGDGQSQTELKLAAVRPGASIVSLRSQQALLGALGFALLPAANFFPFLTPFGPWPWFLWPAVAAAAGYIPVYQLNSDLSKRRKAMRAELPGMIDIFALATSSGVGPEIALIEAQHRLTGPLGEAVAEVNAAAAADRYSPIDGLLRLADRERIDEIRSLAQSWQLSHNQGPPLAPAARRIVEQIREQTLADDVARGARLEIVMMMPTMGLMLPAIMVIVFYPTIIQLLDALGSF